MLVGIDCGGSKNDLILFSENGKVLNRVIAEGSNIAEMGVDNACIRLVKQLDILLEKHGGSSAPVQALFVGLSGGGNPKYSSAVTERLHEALPDAAQIRCASDLMTALYAGVGIGDGMAVIAGTGTSCLVRHKNKLTQVGGWGHLIDDAGSGFWLGRAVLNAALREMDGRGEHTLLTELVNRRLGEDVRKCIPILYQDGKRTIASFSPMVFEATDAGDAMALSFIDQAAEELSLLIRAGSRLIDTAPWRVALVGGLWNAPLILEKVSSLLGEQFELLPVRIPAVYGSALGAMDAASLQIPDDFRTLFLSSLQ